MTKQVIVDNGKGQGAFGTGETWADAMTSAQAHWRESFGPQKPVKYRLCEYVAGDAPESYRIDAWRVILDSAPFVGWGRLLLKLCLSDDLDAGVSE